MLSVIISFVPNVIPAIEVRGLDSEGVAHHLFVVINTVIFSDELQVSSSVSLLR